MISPSKKISYRPGTVADFFTWGDQISIGGTGNSWSNGNNEDIGTWLLNRASSAATPTTSTYNLFEDQVTLAGEVYTDTHFANFTNGNKRVIAMAMTRLLPLVKLAKCVSV